jgi:ABC-type glycerol-3-phosphate transport system substrate-binding protein
MKKIAIALSAAAVLSFAACSDNSSKKEGSDQVKEPVMNSGPETEAERAKEAVKDSANAGPDSTIRHDADAPSTPH